MKKNTMMRIASVMLVLALLTTCVISGTFAKYVTSGTGGDSARVAKWGIKIAVTGDKAFDNEYKNSANKVSVHSTMPVVAPGTTTSEGTTNNTGMRIVISGEAETAFQLTATMTVTREVSLAGGTYSDYRNYIMDDSGNPVVDPSDENKFTFTGTYYPVKYYLNGTLYGETVNNKEYATLSAVADDLSKDSAFYPGGSTVPDTDVILTWAWAFGEDGETQQKDTVLGVAASGTTISGATTNIEYTLTISATQID